MPPRFPVRRPCPPAPAKGWPGRSREPVPEGSGGTRPLPRWGLLWLLTAALPCHAVTGRHELAPEIYSQVAAQDAFTALARVSAGSGLSASFGSGCLLDDQWLLTAAHLVWGRSAAAVTVQWGGLSRQGAELFYPAEWLDGPAVGLTQGGDLALVRLASPLPFGAFTPLAGGALDDRFAVMLGHGRGGNGVLGAFGSEGPRGATNTIDRQFATAAGGGLLVTDFDSSSAPHNTLDAASASRRYYDLGFTDPTLSAIVLAVPDTTSTAAFIAAQSLALHLPGLPDVVAEGTTALGDSGGPLFVQEPASGRWLLAGLTSWGVNPSLPEGFARYDSRYGDLAFFTDLSRHQEWILTVIPEPATVHLLAFAAAALLCRRRARRKESASVHPGIRN